MKIINYYLIAINIYQFLLMGLDKLLAIKHKNRISEKMLLTNSFIGGSIGSIIGMYTFRHKTKHLKFTLGFPIIFLFQLISIFLFLNSNFSIKLFY